MLHLLYLICLQFLEFKGLDILQSTKIVVLFAWKLLVVKRNKIVWLEQKLYTPSRSNGTAAFVNSFIHMTSRESNSLLVPDFPATYNLQSFKSHLHRYLHSIPIQPLIFLHLLFTTLESILAYRCCIFLV